MDVGGQGSRIHNGPDFSMRSSLVLCVQGGSSTTTVLKFCGNLRSSSSYCKTSLSLAQSRQGIVSRTRQTTRQLSYTQPAAFDRGNIRSAIVTAAFKDLPAVDIAIIGGGPGGLVTALALIGAGFSVKVYERRAPKRVGAILSLFPNGLEALSRIRLAPYDEVGFSASHARHCKVQHGVKHLLSTRCNPFVWTEKFWTPSGMVFGKVALNGLDPYNLSRCHRYIQCTNGFP